MLVYVHFVRLLLLSGCVDGGTRDELSVSAHLLVSLLGRLLLVPSSCIPLRSTAAREHKHVVRLVHFHTKSQQLQRDE